MKTIVAGLLVWAFCSACSGKKGKVAQEEFPVEISDTIGGDTVGVSADSAETVAIPKNADELFDDFIYNYAANEKLQKARTVFPLPYTKGEEKLYIEKKNWEHDHLFTKESYYTLLYDREEDMDLEKDLSLDTVTVEWIYLENREIRQYHFQRKNGLWMLVSIGQHSVSDNPNEDFLAFFYKFSNDSVFQRTHIAVPLKFVTSDPDDEFQILETTLEVDQWFAFRPLLPSDRMTNISFGQTYSKDSRRKIIDLKGIGNGFNNTLFFKRSGDEWKLVQFDDLSN